MNLKNKLKKLEAEFNQMVASTPISKMFNSPALSEKLQEIVRVKREAEEAQPDYTTTERI